MDCEKSISRSVTMSTIQTPSKFEKVWTPVFPVLSAFFGILSFIVGYIISVANDHEEAWFSFISDGGSLKPESCIFGILLNFSAFFWFLTCFFPPLPVDPVRSFPSWSTDKVPDHNIHHVGIGRTIRYWDFCCSQFPRKCHSYGTWSWGYVGFLWRVFMAMVVTGALTLHEVCLIGRPFVRNLADGTKPPKPDFPKDTGIFRYKPDHFEYLNHLIAALSEWVLGVGFFIIIASLCYELSIFEVNTMTKEEHKHLAEETRKPVLVSCTFKDETDSQSS
ncbi:unnamed protein product [Bursaphelenchus okinawaensis]|uniref:CWH43-like N-terminal domain-containing protein n=1 Tax=Bursaphelenchus okinawaensis TaxID=465554 RepID=A0A811KFY4_9BILA|nr:unnamed protein product [Bursaphelenchus okinawaensis]CAG9102402.1 unnamed protein product [Bursaphelenchus okinawaensis]